MNTLEKLNLQYLCQNVQVIARLAAKEILNIYNSDYTIENKDDNTPLTSADLAADKIICRELKQLTPEIPILTEESECVAYEIRKTWQRYWLVDPLDGTREFIKRNGEFTVNIALIENHRSVLGVINAPVLQLEYYAWEKGGAYKKQQKQEAQQIHCRKADPNNIIIAGSRSHASDKLKDYIQSIDNNIDDSVDVLSVGSSLKSCMVAEGAVDLYPRLGLTSEWDTAAAQCIVEEAGGFMIQTSESPLLYNTKDSLLNPEFLVYGDKDFNWHEYL